MAYEKRTKEDLQMLQAMPLDVKVRMTEDRIRAWVNEFGEDGVCISFSGGKDSTVLLHLVRNLYPNVKAVFSNTGLEYPEIRQFAMRHDNVDMVYPEIGFKDVITQYGYPLISKEVAEAIYYARRIGGGYTHKRNAKTSVTTYKRGELALYQHKLLPEQTDSSSREISTAYGGGEWSNYNRRCLAPNPNDPKDRKCFWNNRESGASSTASDRQLAQLPTGREKTARTQRLQSRGSDTDGEYP